MDDLIYCAIDFYTQHCKIYYKKMIEKNCDLNSHHGVSRIGMVKKAIEVTEKPNLRHCTATRFKDLHASYTSQLSSTTARPSKKRITRKSNNKVCAYM